MGMSRPVLKLAHSASLIEDATLLLRAVQEQRWRGALSDARRVRSGRILPVPYPIEVNDNNALV